MNRMLATPNLPNPPGTPNLGGSRPFLDWVTGVQQFLVNLRRVLSDQLSQIIGQINSGVQGVGADLASDAAPQPGTIVPDHPIHVVTGAGVIETIAPPAPLDANGASGFSGPVFLIPAGAWTTVTTGNIALASTAIPNRVMVLVYDPRSMKWYPTY